MITKNNYIIGILKEDHMYASEWHFTFLGIINREKYETKYIKVNNGIVEVLINNTWEQLITEDKKPFILETTVFTFTEPIKLPKLALPNLEQDITTTVGRCIFNHLLLANNFHKTIPYVNERTTISNIEKIIAPKLSSGEIKVKEYIGFADSVTFLRGLTRLTNVSATYKNILPPPNLEQEKVRIKEEFTKKYGEDWVNNRTKVVEYQEELKKLDAEWLKGDPTEGRLISSKIRNNARVKMFLTFGPEVGFDKTGEKMTFVEKSLLEGYSNDPKQVAAMFNSSRSGSYDRGKETQKGGAMAKDILRATSSYYISGKDCGATTGKKLFIDKDNYPALEGRNILVGSKVVKVEDPKAYIGKEVALRSPMYCINKDDSFCETCVGERMGLYKTGVSLKTLDISMSILTISLKSMHDVSVKLVEFNMHDNLI